jgi:leader peptidase (prepilin peptidase)/N-methyltransferase
MDMLIVLVAILLGLLVGSFLNVLTFRLMSNTSVVFGRSHCQMCGVLLRARDLIPIFSYLLLLGKCRDCDQPISRQYPLVELATAVAFGIIAVVHLYGVPPFNGLALARDLVFTTALISLFVFDYRWLVLPDQVTIPLIVLAILFNVGLGATSIELIVGALVGGGLYFGLWAISRGAWVGSGDIRLGAAMGFMLSWPGILVALYISYLIGGVVAILLLVTGQKKRGTVLPMGTFLTIGTFAVMVLLQIYPDWIQLLTL